jgi:hypothetical protein
VISGSDQAPSSTEIIDKARLITGIDALIRQRYALAHVHGLPIAASAVEHRSHGPPAARSRCGAAPPTGGS